MKPSLLGHLCFVNAKTFTEVHRIYTPSSLGGEFQEAQWETRLKPSGTKNKRQERIIAQVYLPGVLLQGQGIPLLGTKGFYKHQQGFSWGQTLQGTQEGLTCE